MAKGKKPTPQEIYWERKRTEERTKAALLPAGFVNHGNTCFMNSVLQGLVATHPLEDLVRSQSPDSHQSLAGHRSPLLTNGRGPEASQREWVQGMALGDAFVQIMERSWRMRDARERGSLSPRELLSRLGAKYDQYLDFRQQDAHEFLLHLLDGMRMEEFDIIKKRQPPPPRKRKSRSYTLPAKRHLPEPIPEEERLTSFVDMIFGGKLASVLICETCKHISYTLEDFDDLSLSITHDESKERMRDRLRTFAAKFRSSSSRTRDQPMSFSQPPSPPLRPTTLDVPEDAQRMPRRRSLEALRPSVDSADVSKTSDIPKNDISGGFGGAAGGRSAEEVLAHQRRTRSRKVSEVGLSKLGRKISVGIALAGKKDKKLSKVELESRATLPGAASNKEENEVDADMASTSAPTSRPSSRQLSPAPLDVNRKDRNSLQKPSEYDAKKAEYLHRLLEDAAVPFSSPLAVLRAVSPMGQGINSQWAKVGSVQSIEDCLKMFTNVEALDGDNKFGCRNCWKIANRKSSERRDTQSDTCSESSESTEVSQGEDQPSRPRIVDPIHSLSMPNLSRRKDMILASLPPSTDSPPTSTPRRVLTSESEVIELNSLDLNLGTASKPTASISKELKSETNTTVPHNVPGPLSTEGASFSRPFGSEPVLHGLPIPTITANSPPHDNFAQNSPTTSTRRWNPGTVHSPSPLASTYVTPSQDSLMLPPVQSHHRRNTSREGESSLSSEESEYGDTSGISDGDGSVTLVSTSAGPLPLKSAVPRSKQVVYRRALKRYLIACPPQILVIHLKRFQQVSKSPVTLFGNLKKLDEYVSFPEYLDIRLFLAPKKEDYGLGRGEMRGKEKEKGKRVEDQPCVYRLYAVVVHIGNMLGGHYIAYTALPTKQQSSSRAHGEQNGLSISRPPVESSPAKAEVNPAKPAVSRERQWCYISDTVVRLASLEEVLKSKAYICMYERMP